MNVIVFYRVGSPEPGAALTPALLRLGRDAVEHRVGDEVARVAAPAVVEELDPRLYMSLSGEESVDLSVRPAHTWDSELFPDERAAARYAGVIAAVPMTVDWVRSSYFDRLGATVDCALLLPDVPVMMDLAA